jgi:type VI protein secretion system component VasK
MTAFAYELASVLAAQMRARPGDPAGAYCMPWYLVLGEPGSGRSSAIRAINLSWPFGDGPLQLNAPTTLCSYWLPEKAVFIEPGPQVTGPDRDPGMLQALCTELKDKRPREPLDGVLLVLSSIAIADLDERDEAELARLARTYRSYLSEIYAYLDAEVPIYVVLTAYDTLWGFGDSFQWTLNRKDEEPWGFVLPVAQEPAGAQARIAQEMEGVRARIESVCFAKLSTEDPPDARARAFQHMAEMRSLLAKVGQLLHAITMVNSFERTPWVRSLVVGSAIPGTGDRLRYMAQEFAQMSLFAPAQSRTPQPGGLPMHGLLDHTLWPERDIVPLRSRWRDDGLIMVMFIVAVLAWLGSIGVGVVFALM